MAFKIACWSLLSGFINIWCKFIFDSGTHRECTNVIIIIIYWIRIIYNIIVVIYIKIIEWLWVARTERRCALRRLPERDQCWRQGRLSPPYGPNVLWQLFPRCAEKLVLCRWFPFSSPSTCRVTSRWIRTYPYESWSRFPNPSFERVCSNAFAAQAR